MNLKKRLSSVKDLWLNITAFGKTQISLSRQDDDLSIPSDLLIAKLSDELTLKAFNLQVHFKIYKEITAQG